MRFIVILFIYMLSFSQEKTSFLALMQNKVTQKQMSEKEALVESIRYMFSEYDGKYLPIKNGTKLINAYRNIEEDLSLNVQKEINSYLLKNRSKKNHLSYVSPS